MVSLNVRGVDISMLPVIEKEGGKFYDENGDSVDLVKYLSKKGVNLVRLRLWNDPYDISGNAYGGGNTNYEQILPLVKRIKKSGMKFLLDFHYSDFWVDPGRQKKPKAWDSFGVSEVQTAIYNFTKDILNKFNSEGVPPEYVQLGNEINAGMLWPEGDDSTDVGFSNMCSYLISAANAVYATNIETKPKIILHLAQGGDNEVSRWWFDGVTKNNVPFDIIGVSYYPYWHGTLDDLSKNLNDMINRYGRDVCVVETAYGFTTENGDSCPNLFTKTEAETAGYPATPTGQKNYLNDLKKIISSVNNQRGLGFIYWEPAWIPVSNATWATDEGMKYINTTGVQGDTWDNQAIFDFSGKVLPAISVFEDISK